MFAKKERAGPVLMRFIKCLLLLQIILTIVAVPVVNAATVVPYETYTYLIDASVVTMPNAYVPERIIRGKDIGGLDSPLDLCTDSDGGIYIADTGNNRIVCLEPDYSLCWEITTFESRGKSDALNAPEGVYAAPDGSIYVADTQNGRVVVFDENGKYIREIGSPDTVLLMGGDSEDDVAYNPSKIAVDPYGRLFVVAQNVGMGVLEFTPEGEFSGYVGAQRVSFNLVDYMWKRFMTDEQKLRTSLYVPTEYSNLVCDEEGFLYAVSSALDEEIVQASIQSLAYDEKASPIKKFNASGYDILSRNGYHPPLGDLYVETDMAGKPLVSAIMDVALGPADIYTLLDGQRNRLFTYSRNGELLFAFGQEGTQVGNNLTPVAVAYKGNDLLVLDSRLERITVYHRTSYGDGVIKALDLYNHYHYEESSAVWQEVLKQNSNFELAYNGLGRTSLNGNNFRQAMTEFRCANNRQQYSIAFKEERTLFIKENLLWTMIGIVILLILVVHFSKAVNRCNKKAALAAPNERPKVSYFTYAFHVLTHPIEGFGEIKYERRGSSLASVLIVLGAFVATLAKRVMIAWLFNEKFGEPANVLEVAFSVIGLIIIFVLSNWCLTTLMDGEGSMSNIITAVGYSVFPILLVNLISIPLSYVLTLDEGMYLTFLNGLALVWSLLLLFCGVMVTHQYTLTKNVATCLLTLIGMAVIVFLLLLLLTTARKIVEFLLGLAMELVT